jgi:colanic acid biosynthesis glycosyl transferase WcaI
VYEDPLVQRQPESYWGNVNPVGPRAVQEPMNTSWGRRVLIVGINYAPEYCGIAPYTTAAAEHLVAHGDDVLVFTGVPHYPHWTVPDGFQGRLRMEERTAGVDVRRLRHFVPSRQSAWKRGLYEATFGAAVLAQRLPWRPDVVLAAVPSLLGAAAAAMVAGRESVPLGVWVQDLMGPAAAQSGISGGGQVAVLAHNVERWLLPRAAGVAVISDSFRSYVKSLGVPPERLHRIPNWCHIEPPRGDRELIRKRLGWPDDVVVALHSGNMGLKQGLENIVEAARLAHVRGEKVRFVFVGDGSQRETLEALGAQLPTLDFVSPAPCEDYAEILAAADVLVVNERVGVLDMSLPSKLTSYFLAGRPVVAAVHPEGGTAGEIRDSRAGYVVAGGQPEALLDTVCCVAKDPDLAAHLGARGRSYAQSHLNVQIAMKRFDHFIESLIPRHCSKTSAGSRDQDDGVRRSRLVWVHR